MLDLNKLKAQFGKMDFFEKRPGIYKVLIPFFYEDGDMYDLFIEECPGESGKIRISDYGLTLMKLSYDFNIDTIKKIEILNNIVIKNRCYIDEGNIYLDIHPKQFEGAIYQFIQTISRVSNLDIIGKEVNGSMFFELLNDFAMGTFKDFDIQTDVTPLADSEFKIDYVIPASRPVYLFGVNDNSKASKVVITCLNLNAEKVKYRSLVVPEKLNSLSGFNQKQIINTSDKLFTDLEQFKISGFEYVRREVVA